MELNREQIIKALECCTVGIGTECEKCPYMLTRFCNDTLKKDILVYIKELTEKCENYRTELGEVRIALAEANNDKKQLTEENERLKAHKERLEELRVRDMRFMDIYMEATGAKKVIADTKADTVRKMQERLNEYLDDTYSTGEDVLIDIKEAIDQIAKEIENE